MATLSQTNLDGVAVLKITGSLNQHGVDSVEPAFNAAAGTTSRLVVDLSDVDVVNTPAIAMFLGAHRTAKKAGGRLVFTGVRGLVDDLLRRCRLDTVLTIAPAVDDAVEWAKQ